MIPYSIMESEIIKNAAVTLMYRGRLYSAQSMFKEDPGRARQNSLATAGMNFTKPEAHHYSKSISCNDKIIK